MRIGAACDGRGDRFLLRESDRIGMWSPNRRCVERSYGSNLWACRRTSLCPDDYHHTLSARGMVSVPSLRSEEHTSELQSLMRISYAVLCLKKKKQKK